MEPVTSSRLDGVPAVTLVVAKQSGENTVNTARDIKERLKEIQATLPKDIHTQIVGDQSTFIEAAVSSIKHHLIEGSIFASVIIFIFLANWRTTLIAAIAIPTSIISTFAMMAAMGFTLNQISMLALTLMVGIVIDDAIIVLENIFRFIEEKGMSPMKAAVEGTKEIGLAVMATTLSLLAVFLPVGFMGGIVGRFMSSFGFTSAFAIGVSLLVSFTLTPMLSSRFIKPSVATPPPDVEGNDAHAVAATSPAAHSSKNSFIFHAIDVRYTAMLKWALAHRAWMLGFCVLTIASIVPLFMFVGKNFLPADDQSQYNVQVRTPEGTSLAATTALSENIAKDIRGLPGVEHTLMTAGGGADASVNTSTIYVKLTDLDKRTATQEEMMQKTRAVLKRYPKEIHSGVELVSSVGGNQSNADIQYFIQGPDLDHLQKYSDALIAKVNQIQDATDADTTLRKPGSRKSGW